MEHCFLDWQKLGVRIRNVSDVDELWLVAGVTLCGNGSCRVWMCGARDNPQAPCRHLRMMTWPMPSFWKSTGAYRNKKHIATGICIVLKLFWIYIYNYNIYIIYNMLYIYEKNKDVGTRCLWRCCRTVLTKQWWLRSLVLDPLVNSGGKRILCCQERLTGCNTLKKVETCWSSSFQYLIPAGLLRDASDLYGLHLRKARKQQRDRKLPKTQAWRTYFVCLCVEREYSKVETAG